MFKFMLFLSSNTHGSDLNESLMKVAEIGDLKEVKALIDSGADVNVENFGS